LHVLSISLSLSLMRFCCCAAGSCGSAETAWCSGRSVRHYGSCSTRSERKAGCGLPRACVLVTPAFVKYGVICFGYFSLRYLAGSRALINRKTRIYTIARVCIRPALDRFIPGKPRWPVGARPHRNYGLFLRREVDARGGGGKGVRDRKAGALAAKAFPPRAVTLARRWAAAGWVPLVPFVTKLPSQIKKRVSEKICVIAGSFRLQFYL
ncbi:hypothetical protein BAE44_0017815, partial [Dichanthelium oligosanthes]